MKRIISLILAFAVAAVSLQARQIKGTVTSKGKPLKGVIVTDGINFTTTSEFGSYSLKTTDKTEWVSIVTPKGYQPKVVSGAPTFFQKLSDQVDEYNFDLIKSRYKGSDYALIAMGDPQLKKVGHNKLYRQRALPALKQHGKTYSKKHHLAGIALGDEGWDAFPRIEQYKKDMSSLKYPFYQIIGNHDHDRDEEGDWKCGEKFRGIFGPTEYCFQIGDDYVIGLDNIEYYGNKKYDEMYGKRALDFLSGILPFIPQNCTLYIAQHSPLYYYETPDTPWAINCEQVFQLLRGRDVIFISGHTHTCDNYDYAAMRPDGVGIEHNVGSACGSWWDTPYSPDGTPSGVKIYERKNGVLTWRYVGFGMSPEYQADFFGLGEMEDDPGSVYVNVWDWDSTWKVEWFEDGVYRGYMEKCAAPSPRYVKLINAVFKNSKKPIPEYKQPKATGHMFRCTPSETTSEVKVVITNGFGDEFKVAGI